MVVSSIAFALVLAGQDAYTLKPAQVRGASRVYEISFKDAETSVEGAIEHTVKQVASDGGYTIESKSLGAIIRFGGGEMRDDRPSPSTARFDAHGRLIEITDGSAGLEKYRSALLTRFVSPPVAAKVGTTWKYERSANSPKGLAATTIEYTFRSVSQGNAVVAFTLKEASGEFPQRATGTWWIDVATGVPVKMEAKVTNFVGTESGETTVTLTLRKPA